MSTSNFWKLSYTFIKTYIEKFEFQINSQGRTMGTFSKKVAKIIY